VRGEILQTNPDLPKPERTVTVICRRGVDYAAEHSSSLPVLEVLELDVYPKKVEINCCICAGRSRTDSSHTFAIVNCTDMRCELVQAGESRGVAPFDTPDHRAPEWFLFGVLSCDASLEFPLSREGPFIVAAIVVAREVLTAFTLSMLLPRSRCGSGLVITTTIRLWVEWRQTVLPFIF
jgi:hypothetical protein